MLNITWVEYCCNLSLFVKLRCLVLRQRYSMQNLKTTKHKIKYTVVNREHLERHKMDMDWDWLKIRFLRNSKEICFCSMFSFRSLLRCIHFCFSTLFKCRALLKFLAVTARQTNWLNRPQQYFLSRLSWFWKNLAHNNVSLRLEGDKARRKKMKSHKTWKYFYQPF